jgi:salicylate biosynthesis isochorismate synthase/menaquinone-specific isochorismate synthase
VSHLAVRRRVQPIDALAALAGAPPGDRFYLEHPAAGRARVAVGAAACVEAAGPDRFREAARRAEALLARVETVGDPGPASAGPQVLGGFAFEDAPGAGDWAGFAAASLVLPGRLLVREGDACWLTAIAPAGRDGASTRARLEADLDAWLDAAGRSGPDLPGPAPWPVEHRITPDRAPAGYVAQVERALRDVARGEIEKVVAARSITVGREGGWLPERFLAGLRASFPSCASFLVARGAAAFFGATPERLLRREGTRVETAAIAGTARRGRSPERDRALARALLESKKEQAEHAAVLRFLRERLARHADRVEAPEAPELLKLEGLQHLRTPVSAELARPVGALELAGELHPTPATGGAPPEAARAWLARHEALDRGWYAGPVGWCDASGDGELWVALRSGLARDERLRLFAGAGIVEGSDPEAELAETRLKLNALLQRALEI